MPVLSTAIGKIELDNFRERTTMGKRGSAKRGRMPAGAPPYGYRTGEDGKLEIYEPEAEVVRRVFQMYVHEGMAGTAIVRQLTRDNAPTRKAGSRWHKAYVLGNQTYTGTWWYGKARWIVTEAGESVYPQPKDSWIEVPIPSLVDEETWERAQDLKKQRRVRPTRNTKTFYRSNTSLSAPNAGGSSPPVPPTAPTSTAMASATGRIGSPLSGTITATECSATASGAVGQR